MRVGLIHSTIIIPMDEPLPPEGPHSTFTTFYYYSKVVPNPFPNKKLPIRLRSYTGNMGLIEKVVLFYCSVKSSYSYLVYKQNGIVKRLKLIIIKENSLDELTHLSK